MIRKLFKGILIWIIIGALIGTAKDSITYVVEMAKYRRETVTPALRAARRQNRRTEWKIKGSDFKRTNHKELTIVIPGVDTTVEVNDTTLLKINNYTINVRPE